MIKVREKEQKTSLIWCIPIAMHFPSFSQLSLFRFLWTAEQRMGKDVPSYKTDISVVQFSSMH